jgi:purine catabolism regulator
MRFTVKDAMEMDVFRNANVIAGHEGLNNEITSVTVVDTPDIKHWLKGGELLLTNAYVFKDNVEQLVNIVSDIKHTGASALGIKLKRFVDTLPQDMISQANRCGIPLITIPVEYSWIDVMGPVMSEIINRKTDVLERTIEIHKLFTDIVLNGGDIQSIINRLIDLINIPVIFLPDKWQDDDNVVYGERIIKGFENSAKQIKDIVYNWKDILDYSITSDTKVRYSVDGYYAIMPVQVEGKIYGHIVGIIGEGSIGRIETIAMEWAATNIAIEILKGKAVLEAEKRFKYDFLLDLLTGNIKSADVIMSRGGFYGWDFSGRFVVVVIDFDDFSQFYLKEGNKDEVEMKKVKNRLLSIVEKKVSMFYMKSIYMNKSDSINIIINIGGASSNEAKKTLKEMARCIMDCFDEKRVKPSVSIGIGMDYSAEQLHLSYKEAKQAISIGRKAWGKGKVYHYKDLGIYKFITHDSVAEFVDEFYEDTIKKVIEYDRDKGANLTHTLYTYLEHNSIGEAASALFIHPNTLRYRLQRIEEITGLCLSNHEHRLNLEIGLKIYRLRKQQHVAQNL